MQFSHALNCYLQEILLADPALVPLYLIKVDISDGFYCIALNINDIPKLGVLFQTEKGQQPFVALPLLLPIDWEIVHPFSPQRPKQLPTWPVNRSLIPFTIRVLFTLMTKSITCLCPIQTHIPIPFQQVLPL